MIGDYVDIGVTNLTIFTTREDAECFLSSLSIVAHIPILEEKI